MGTKKTYYAWENKDFRKNMKDISSSRNCFLFSTPIDILKHFQAPGKSFNTTDTDPEKSIWPLIYRIPRHIDCVPFSISATNKIIIGTCGKREELRVIVSMYGKVQNARK